MAFPHHSLLPDALVTTLGLSSSSTNPDPGCLTTEIWRSGVLEAGRPRDGSSLIKVGIGLADTFLEASSTSIPTSVHIPHQGKVSTGTKPNSLPASPSKAASSNRSLEELRAEILKMNDSSSGRKINAANSVIQDATSVNVPLLLQNNMCALVVAGAQHAGRDESALLEAHRD